MENPVDASPGESETIPPDRWKASDQRVPSGDFAREADVMFRRIEQETVVALDIGVDSAGTFTDVRTGSPVPEVIAQYSRMKHGDLDAVARFAGRLASTAMRTERFVSLFDDAIAQGRVVFMTTPAVFNVPSASNLLLDATAARLNIALSRLELGPVVVVEQTRLSDSPLGYASTAVNERRDGLGAGRGVTIVPEFFRDQTVIFLDDLFSTGYTVHRAEARLRRVGAANRFYLFAVRMDPQTVDASGGQVEDLLNDAFLPDELPALAPTLRAGRFSVVQKLVKLVLHPKHIEPLPAFLRELPTATILGLYAAAAGDGFRHRHQRFYLPSLVVLERVLHDRGVLDDDGLLADPSLDQPTPRAEIPVG